MKKYLISFLSLLLGIPAIAMAKSIDQIINDTVQPFTEILDAIIFVPFQFHVNGKVVEFPIVVALMVGAALYFTIHFRFINFRYFKLALDIVRGKYADLQEKGEVSHFQALTAALSGTVGLGNIAGVAVAISVGGPGACFWIIIAGLAGMTLKFVECTLGVKYREIDDAGVVYGGPMYYLSKGFASMRMDIGGKESHFSRIGKVLAVVFSVSCVLGSLGGGNMLQINQAYKQFNDITATEIVLSDVGSLVGTEVFPKDKQSKKYVLTAVTGELASLKEESSGEMSSVSTANLASQYVTKPLDNYGWLVGIVMAIMVGVVIIGGIKSIARVTDKIVPLMCGMYVIAGLFVIAVNWRELPSAISTIVTSAFGYEQLAGGALGVLIVGFKRAAFSNEAGIGSASIAHSAVKTNYPASEGLVSLMEPFIDTVVICTMTALVIVISGKYIGSDLGDGISITSNAFATVISWFPYVLFGAVVLFAFSTMISWSYYGMQAWAYLFGRSKSAEYIYKGIFCLMVIVGAAMDLKPVMAFSDTSIFMMLFPNIIGLIFLAPVVRHELAVYLGKIKEMQGAKKEGSA